MKKLIILLIGLLFYSFTIQKSNEIVPVKSESNFVVSPDPAILYKNKCGFCHKSDGLMAPNMTAIKAVYLKKFPKKIDFVNAISNFVKQPNKKTALYRKNIENFMEMPKMPFKDEDVKATATYIYEKL